MGGVEIFSLGVNFDEAKTPPYMSDFLLYSKHLWKFVSIGVQSLSFAFVVARTIKFLWNEKIFSPRLLLLCHLIYFSVQH